jgi:hypothetical protein
MRQGIAFYFLGWGGPLFLWTSAGRTVGDFEDIRVSSAA